VAPALEVALRSGVGHGCIERRQSRVRVFGVRTPVLELLGRVELEHGARNNRVRAFRR
jgi:hypothetical protein